MGRLDLPDTGAIYIDAQIPIYASNGHPVYAPVIELIWQSAQAGDVTVVSSELTLLETLVSPLRSGDVQLAAVREALWNRPNMCLRRIDQDILREAARLRAAVPGLKTPDAIHAATALLHNRALFITIDVGFRRVPGLPLAILDDVIAAP